MANGLLTIAAAVGMLGHPGCSLVLPAKVLEVLLRQPALLEFCPLIVRDGIKVLFGCFSVGGLGPLIRVHNLVEDVNAVQGGSKMPLGSRVAPLPVEPQGFLVEVGNLLVIGEFCRLGRGKLPTPSLSCLKTGPSKNGIVKMRFFSRGQRLLGI